MHNINIRTLDLNLLVVFLTLWETQSVTRASERLALSQSAVSHALRRLRERMGDELFVLGRTGLLPTSRATEIIGPVREALEKIDQVLQGGSTFSPGTTQRTFRIAAGDFVEFMILPKLLQHISTTAAGVVIEVVPLPDPLALSLMLESGAIDLMINTPAVLGAGVRSEKLATVQLQTLIWQREGLKAGRFPMALYLERPHVVISMHERGGNIIDRTLAAQSLRRPIGAVVQNFMAMPVIASQTGYICNLPSPIAQAFAKAYKLSCHAPPIEFPEPELIVCWHTRFDADAGLQWMRDLVRQCALA
ncbi:LysR family transcriptional regulator [Pseudomonas rustica]|jgi:DNA-binding transcriptional LysR family regulator|uniref:LysR family transcriptional regulator n=1 Tax=Pseudomonas rustica TaxID=2827099 RepID=UPI003CF3B41A